MNQFVVISRCSDGKSTLMSLQVMDYVVASQTAFAMGCGVSSMSFEVSVATRHDRRIIRRAQKLAKQGKTKWMYKEGDSV